MKFHKYISGEISLSSMNKFSAFRYENFVCRSVNLEAENYYCKIILLTYDI